MGARTTVRHRLNNGTIQPMKVTGLAVAAIAAAPGIATYADLPLTLPRGFVRT